MWWILVWALLVLVAVAAAGLLGWRLFRQVLALGREVGASGARIAAALERPQHLEPVTATSVFLDPDSQPDVAVRSRGSRHRRA